MIVGPAAWHFGWERTDWDALAGAVVAGHIIDYVAANHLQSKAQSKDKIGA